MKARTGFVSNSSSSSYTVVMHRTYDLKEELERVFHVPDNHPLKPISKDVVDFFMSPDYTYKNVTDLDDCEADDPWWINKINNGQVIRGYSAGSDNYGTINEYLCYNGIDYEDDRISIHGGGGY